MNTKIEVDPKDICKIICADCHTHSNHKVLVAVLRSGSEIMNEQYGVEYQWHDDYQIVECLGCGEVSFRTISSNSEDFDPRTGEHAITEKVYPERDSKTKRIIDFYNVPSRLRNIYAESIKSYNSNCLTLCGVGLRAIVEGVCKEFGIKKGPVESNDKNGNLVKNRVGSLNGKINGLAEQGILLTSQADVLHEHRFLGNDAVHDLTKPRKGDLSLAIEIIETILNTLYEMPQKASELKTARLNKKK